MAIFDHYIIMDDVEVADLTGTGEQSGVAGPQALRILRSAGFEVSQTSTAAVREVTWRDTAIIVISMTTKQLRRTSCRRHTPQRRIFGRPCWTQGLRQLATGTRTSPHCFWNSTLRQDIRERDLPQETEQARALHFTKGCYVGQEIVERIRSRGQRPSQVRRIPCRGTVTRAWAPRFRSMARTWVKSQVSLRFPCPRVRARWRLVIMRREAATPGKELTAGGARLSVANLPLRRIQ